MSALQNMLAWSEGNLNLVGREREKRERERGRERERERFTSFSHVWLIQMEDHQVEDIQSSQQYS